MMRLGLQVALLTPSINTKNDTHTMKTSHSLITAAVSGVIATSFAQAEITLSDELSLSGYIDAAYVDMDDGMNLEGSVAELELGFAFNPTDSPFTAVAELSFKDGTDDPADEFSYETVTLTYAACDSLSFSVGNILSYQGFETFDATGLYQFSYSGRGNSPFYSAGYAVGASVDYVTDEYGLGLWIGETDDSLSYEILAQYTAIEGLTLKAIYADDPGYETINVWGSYTVGDWTFGAEYIENDENGGTGLAEDGYMALVNYAMGDAAITLRYSAAEYADGDYTKFTVSPSYAFSDNLLGLLEASFVDDDANPDTELELAAELLFTF